MCIFTRMPEPFLETISVSKIYAGNQAAGLKETSIAIVKGVVTAIIGESGSGKSTLLGLLYGLLSPDKGVVRFKGERIWGPAEKLIPGHDAMKMVTQHTDDLNILAKVWDNVAAMLPNTDLKAKKEHTEKILTQLRLTALANKQVITLSGGEKQRVAIARTLVSKPEILLLDEPFNQVDTSFREGLQNDIRQIVKDTGLTVIIVSHDPAEVLSMADELLVIKDGVIIEAGTPKLIYEHPKTLYTARLLTNCSVLSPTEGELLGIKTLAQIIVIYPEWVEPVKSFSGNLWTIRRILFKGSYEDLILENQGASIRAFNIHPEKFKEGDKVSITLKRWLEY